VKSGIGFWLILTLTLGLAPFDEPHIWGKILWLKGGAVGMAFMDWFDLLLHGTPWIGLVYSFVRELGNRVRKKHVD
jgi:uncharacterized membrane protein